MRLDELEHVRFSVSVKTRLRNDRPWQFLEAWGLNPYLRTWGAVHLERGAWQAWPAPAARTTIAASSRRRLRTASYATA